MDRDKALKKLRKMLKPGEVVYTILRRVAPSGTSRIISLVLIRRDGPRDISWLAALGLGRSYDREQGGLRMRGGGMDMGFEAVYCLGSAVYPGGHGSYVSGRNGSPDPETDGGYCLRHRWL